MHDYWDGLGPRIALELLEHLHPIYFRQLQIQQHQFGRMIKRSVRERSPAEEKVQSFLAIAGHENVVCQLLPPQRVQGKIHIVLIVFHQQYVEFL